MTAGPFDFLDKNGYENSFCGCFGDLSTCLFACCCLPCAVGKLTGQTQSSSFSCISCCFCPLGVYRNRRNIQMNFELGESEDGSMIAAGCCPCCATAQDMHEWNVRKVDKSQEAPIAVAVPVYPNS